MGRARDAARRECAPMLGARVEIKERVHAAREALDLRVEAAQKCAQRLHLHAWCQDSVSARPRATAEVSRTNTECWLAYETVAHVQPGLPRVAHAHDGGDVGGIQPMEPAVAPRVAAGLVGCSTARVRARPSTRQVRCSIGRAPPLQSHCGEADGDQGGHAHTRPAGRPRPTPPAQAGCAFGWRLTRRISRIRVDRDGPHPASPLSLNLMSPRVQYSQQYE